MVHKLGPPQEIIWVPCSAWRRILKESVGSRSDLEVDQPCGLFSCSRSRTLAPSRETSFSGFLAVWNNQGKNSSCWHSWRIRSLLVWYYLQLWVYLWSAIVLQTKRLISQHHSSHLPLLTKIMTLSFGDNMGTSSYASQTSHHKHSDFTHTLLHDIKHGSLQLMPYHGHVMMVTLLLWHHK